MHIVGDLCSTRTTKPAFSAEVTQPPDLRQPSRASLTKRAAFPRPRCHNTDGCATWCQSLKRSRGVYNSSSRSPTPEASQLFTGHPFDNSSRKKRLWYHSTACWAHITTHGQRGERLPSNGQNILRICVGGIGGGEGRPPARCKSVWSVMG